MFFAPYAPPPPDPVEFNAQEADESALLGVAECGVFEQESEDLFEDCLLSVISTVMWRVESDIWPDAIRDNILRPGQFPGWALFPECPGVAVCPSEAYWLHRLAYQAVGMYEDGARGTCDGYENYHSIPEYQYSLSGCTVVGFGGGVWVEWYARL